MQRNWVLPALIIGTMGALVGAMNYPFLPAAQDLQGRDPYALTLPPGLVNLPAPPTTPTSGPVVVGQSAVPASANVVPAAASGPMAVEGNNAGEKKTPPTQKVTEVVVKKPNDAPIRQDAQGKYTFNGTTVKIEVTLSAAAPGAELVVFRDGRSKPEKVADLTAASASFTFTDLELRDNRLTFAVRKDGIGPPSRDVHIEIRQSLPLATGVTPQNLAFNPGTQAVVVHFDTRNPVLSQAAIADKFKLANANATTAAPPTTQLTVNSFDPNRNTAEVNIGNLTSGVYKLTVAAGIEDIYGNKSADPQSFEILKPVGSELPLVAPGISSPTGPYVPYPEFTNPRKKPDVFGTGDHVETRVVRLYYFRDAHRVAQILNRDLKSYNRVTVDTRRRAAESARATAQENTLTRKVLERDAVQSAQETRVAEQEVQAARLAQAQANVAKNQADQARDPAKPTQAQTDKVTQAQGDVDRANARLQSAQTSLQIAQSAEVQKRGAWQNALDREDKEAGDVFRLGVAAMHEDPDSYAVGHPELYDPVRQVSISVIGASEIHLRGPISGINVIREMVHQIDAPAGQVRIAVHTVQVNGERQEKMEHVVADIQDYIDHSRFLTQQSALMLRKAVLKVASRKAYLAALQNPQDSQEARDERYLRSFFGQDFIHELQVQKSEFLYTGNKLLSLNSMDTTSLASALFVIALAKNDTRQEILAEFRQMLAVELPMAEQTFYEAGGPRTTKHPLGWNCGCFQRKQCFELMAQNARFQSFIGFFDADVTGADTLTPLQREFIKLAQILKSRLVTELELKQRVMERALAADRMGDLAAEMDYAKKENKLAQAAYYAAQKQVRTHQAYVLSVMPQVYAEFVPVLKQEDISRDLLERLECTLASIRPGAGKVDQATASSIAKRLRDHSAGRASALLDNQFKGPFPLQASLFFKNKTAPVSFTYLEVKGMPVVTIDEKDKDTVNGWLGEVRASLIGMKESLDTIKFDPEEKAQFNSLNKSLLTIEGTVKKFDASGPLELVELIKIVTIQKDLIKHVVEIATALQELSDQMNANLGKSPPDVQRAYIQWIALKKASEKLQQVGQDRVKPLITQIDEGFKLLTQAESERRQAADKMQRLRFPLDHKKMLDMLIDETHDKFVELLEGTRSYTANIDDYIKRVATALDDDFNTQFYHPAFRRIRNTAASWDVTLGQIETTSILTNNRTYAKVDPQAMMEFDLPRRKILITEALQSSKALIDTYGALMQDPTFINLTRINAGMPTSTPSQGQNAGVPGIRSVLPGLGGATDESLLAQSGAGAKSFGTPLDALVPDPAIYKFETGTAYEIRPVIQPDGQSVGFRFNYMYTTNIREPVRADEKHLGRIKRHFIDTDVQLGNYELREISKYQVMLRASRTAKGVPLLQDIPGLGILFRPLPSAESSLQQNIIMGQATIFPTLFDLMGLRWAPVIADLDPLALTNADFVVRQRRQFLNNRIYDFSSSKVDEALGIPEAERRGDLYRSQQTVPYLHPNGYRGPGMGLRDTHMREGYDSLQQYPDLFHVPDKSREGHLNPKADIDYRKREKSMGPTVLPPYTGPMPKEHYPDLKGEKSMGPTFNQPVPQGLSIPHTVPGPSFIPPPPMPLPQLQLGPQSRSSTPAKSVFTTVRLSSADLAGMSGDRSGTGSVGYPLAVQPAPRRTLWSTLFGGR